MSTQRLGSNRRISAPWDETSFLAFFIMVKVFILEERLVCHFLIVRVKINTAEIILKMLTSESNLPPMQVRVCFPSKWNFPENGQNNDDGIVQ